MGIKGLIVGALFGVTAAVCCALIFVFTVSSIFLTVGTPLMFVEIFLQIILPFLILFSLAGAHYKRVDRIKESSRWIISIIMGFIVVVYAGTAGSLMMHVIVWGDELKHLAVGNILVWGFIYGCLLLPLTAPISRWLILLLMICCKYFEHSRYKEGNYE